MKVENDYWILSQGRFIRLFGILPNDWWLKDYTGHLKGLVVTNWYPARSKWNSPSILQIWSDGFDSFCNKFRCSHFHHDLNHCLTLQLFGPLTCYASTPVCGTVRGSNYKFSQLLFELQIFFPFSRAVCQNLQKLPSTYSMTACSRSNSTKYIWFQWKYYLTRKIGNFVGHVLAHDATNYKEADIILEFWILVSGYS